MLITKPVHFAIGCGLAGALFAFGIGCLLSPDDQRVFADGNKLVYVICCPPQPESLLPWYLALSGYIIAYTIALLITQRRYRPDIFRRPRWCFVN